jgi:hypothetical protein
VKWIEFANRSAITGDDEGLAFNKPTDDFDIVV